MENRRSELSLYLTAGVVTEKTEGESLASNIQLVLNNAARTATHLSTQE